MTNRMILVAISTPKESKDTIVLLGVCHIHTLIDTKVILFWWIVWLQSINMDLYNKMAAVYQQQVNQTTQQMSGPLPSTHVQGG